MKYKFNTPLWIIISALSGLATFYITMKTLDQYIRDQRDVSLQPMPSDSNSAIKVKVSQSGYIDTVYFAESFQQDFWRKNSKLRYSNLNDNAYLNLNPKVLKWIVFQSVLLAFCVASLPFILFLTMQSYIKCQKHFRWQDYAGMVVGILCVFLALWYTSNHSFKVLGGPKLMEYFNIIFDDPAKATSLIIMSLFSFAFIPLMGILICIYRTYFTFENATDAKFSESEKISEYQEIKNELNVFAFYLGFLVSCAVIGTGLLRDMIVAQIDERLYPMEMVYTYGISFSVILALFFIPSFAYLRKTGGNYQDEMNDSHGWLGIGKDTLENAKLAFSIFLPLISSIVQPMVSLG